MNPYFFWVTLSIIPVKYDAGGVSCLFVLQAKKTPMQPNSIIAALALLSLLMLQRGWNTQYCLNIADI